MAAYDPNWTRGLDVTAPYSMPERLDDAPMAQTTPAANALDADSVALRAQLEDLTEQVKQLKVVVAQQAEKIAQQAEEIQRLKDSVNQ